MAHYDGSIRINTLINTDGLSRGESAIRSSVNRISGALKGFASVIGAAFAVGSIIEFGKECIELGSDLEEVQNVVDVTFTTMSKKVDEFARNAVVSAGLSETMAKRYVGTFGAMANAFGFTEAEAYDMATALTQLSGDVASFYNITQDEAYDKLKSVFTGETETLKELGVVMTEAALDQYALSKGIGKTTRSMTEQEKVALRMQFVTEQLSLASGDFVRTSDSWANQVRILKLQFESLKATIGQGLINIFTPVLKVINTLLGKLATLANAFKAFTQLIAGKKSSSGGGGPSASTSRTKMSDMASGYNDAAQAAEKYTSSTKMAASAMKKAEKAARGYLSPLDEINKLQKEENGSSGGSGGGGGGAGGGAGEEVDYGNLEQGATIVDDISEKFDDLFKNIKEGFKSAFKADVSQLEENLKRIKKANKDVWESPEVKKAIKQFKKKAAKAIGAIAGGVSSLAASFAVGLTGGIASAKEQLVEFRKIKISSIFGNLTNLAEDFEALGKSIGTIGKAFESPGFQKVVEILNKIVSETVLTGLDYITGALADLFSGFKSVWDNAEGFRLVLEDIFDIWSLLLDPVEVFFDYFFGGSKNYEDTWLHKFFENLQLVHSLGLHVVLEYIHQGLSLIKEILQGNLTLADAWKILFGDSKLGKAVTKVLNSIKTGLEIIKGILQGKLTLGDVWNLLFGDSTSEKMKKQGNNIVSGLKAGIEEKWSDFKAYWQGKKEAIVNKFSDIKEKFLTKGRNIIAGIKSGITEKWEDFKTYWQEKKKAIVDRFSDIKEKFLTKGSNIVAGLKSGIKEKWSDFSSYWQEKKKAIVERFSDIKEKFLVKGKNIVSGLKSGVSQNWSAFFSYWSEKKKAIIEKFSDVKEKFSSKGKKIISGLKSGISGMWSEFSGFWSDKKKEIVDKFSDIKDSMKTVGQNIVNGIIEGIRSIWSTLTGWATDIANLFKIDVAKPRVTASGGSSSGARSAARSVPYSMYSPAIMSLAEIDPPGYATGQVIPRTMKKHLAYLGDNNQETEVVSPLSTMKQAFLEAAAEAGIMKKDSEKKGNTSYRFTAQINRRTLFDEMITEAKLRQGQSGRNPFELA